MERDAVGPFVDRGDDLTRRRQAGVEDEGRHESRLGAIERSEAHLLGDPLGQKPRPPVTQRGSGRRLVEPIGPDHEERTVTRVARASSAMISRLRSSAHWRSSNTSAVGRSRSPPNEPDDVDDEHPTTGALGDGGRLAEREQVAPRGSPKAGSRRALRARSRMDAAGTSRSWGARYPPTTRNRRARAVSQIALTKRDFPMPASPAMRRSCP